MHPALRQAIVLGTSIAISHTVSNIVRSNTTPTGLVSGALIFVGAYALSGYVAKQACDTIANDIDELIVVADQFKKTLEKKQK